MRRAARSLAKTIGLGGVFVVALAGGLVLHLDVPVVRRAVVARVNDVLASVVAGRIVIDQVGSLGPGRVAGVDAHVTDPDGHVVLRASGVSGRIALEKLVRSLIAGGDVVIDLDAVSVARVDVDLGEDGGDLRLARAFASAQPSAPPSPSGGGVGVRLFLPHAAIGHIAARGQPPGAPPVDADVDAVEAGVGVVPGKVTVELRHAQLVARDVAPGVTARGAVEGTLVIPAPSGDSLFARASWSGDVGQLAGTARATFDAGKLDAVVDVPAAPPECVRALWAACPFGESVSAHAEVRGTLPELAVGVRATVGRGAVTITGPASLGAETRASLHVAAKDVDLRAITPSAPPSELTASGDAMLVVTDRGEMGVVAAIELAEGKVDGAPIPATTVVARLERDADAAIRAQANVAVHEAGAPVTATVRLSPKGSSFAVDFDAAADVPRLDGVPRLGPVAQGSARARVRGTVDLGESRVDARLEASAAAVHAGSAQLDSASLTAHIAGPLAAPRIDADVTGGHLAAGPLVFDTLHVQVHGDPTHAPVDVALHGHGADFTARADVDLRGGVTLRDVAVAVARNGESAHARAALVRVSAAETSTEGVEVEGLGSPLNADVRVVPGLLHVRAESRGLDLVRVGRLAGVSGAGGRIAVDVDADLRAASAEGHIVLDLAQGSFGAWKDATAHVDAQVNGRRAWGSLSAAVGDVGKLEVTSSSLELARGGPLEAASWRTAWGAVDVAAHVDLTRLAANLPEGTLPLSRVSGTVDVKARVERDSADDATPAVDVTAETHALALVGGPLWRIDGVGAKVHAHVDGKTGRTAVDADLSDATGSLLALSASSDAVPYRAIFTADTGLRAALLAMPVEATLKLPARDVGTLPAFLGMHGMRGTIEASVDWKGTALDPTAELHASLTKGKAEISPLAVPVDLAVAARYSAGHGEASISAGERDKEVVDARASVDVRAADLFADGEPPWTASLHADVRDFPLQSISALDNRQVRGLARGTLQVDDLHRDARASVSLALDHLEVGDVQCRPTTLSATIDGHAMDFAARIAEEDGYAEAKAHLGSSWGRALGPSPDRAQPATMSLTAKHFRAAALLPFVSSIFTELDGRIDADASVEIDPAAQTMKPRGSLALTEGVFEVSSLGSELHDATAKVTLSPDGVVRLDGFSAKGLSGRVQAAATARFQGFALAGAHALVQVPKKEPLPLVVDGVQIGMIDGRVDVSAQRGKDALDVDVDVPALRLQLPAGSTHAVQALGELPGVKVGVARGGEFAAVQLDGDDEDDAPAAPRARLPVRVAVKLGKDVEVMRGADLDVRLDGAPSLTIGDAVTATGQIRLLPYGTLNVQGKTFHIENGTVTFVDDPANPQVVLTASWAAQDTDGTVIYADFVGPLKTGKVTLRSVPSHSQSDILAILLYGATDTGASQASSNGSQQLGAASGAAGNVASGNINRALGGVNRALDSIGLNAGISTKLDTSQPTPRPEVELQIARDISIQVAWVLGVPPPGSNPDTYLFTVNWRFLRQWWLSTTRGDQGTTIFDVVWQHRY